MLAAIVVGRYGDTYRAYQRRVPMFIPRFGEGHESPAELPVAPTAACPETLAR
jgi:hypothetical protein